VGVSVRKKGNDFYIFVRHAGQRAAQKCVDQQHAEDVQKAVIQAISAGQFDIAKLRHRQEGPKEEKPNQEQTSTLTLKEYYEETLQPLWEGSLSRNTYLSYDSSFRIHIPPALGDLLLSDIRRKRLKQFIADLRKKPVSRGLKKIEYDIAPTARVLSKETIRNIVAALRAGLREAVEDDENDKPLIPANPVQKLGKYYKEASDFHEDIDAFSAVEVSRLLQTTREHYGYENYVLLLTLFHCGLRAGEASALGWSDLDVRNKTLLVRRQITRGRKGKPKTRKKRPVDVSTVLLAELQTLKKQRQTEYLAQGQNEIPDLIFLSPGQILWKDGKPVGRKDRGHVDMDNFRNRVF
jgi:integrase